MSNPLSSPPLLSATSYFANNGRSSNSNASQEKKENSLIFQLQQGSHPSGSSLQPPTSFASPSPYQSQYSSPTFNKNENHWSLTVTKEKRKVETDSVALSCLSPDSMAVHSFVSSEGTILTHFLPLSSKHDNDNDNNNDDEEDKVELKVVRSHLPEHVLESLRMDPPMELLCIDNDTPPPTNSRVTTKRLPLLCLYSSAAAFVLSIEYDYTPNNNKHSVEGNVISVIEPFEAHLLSLTATSPSTPPIRRIRAAPSHHAALCPRGAMAMIDSNNSLVLYHGLSHPFVTIPVTLRTEALQQEGNDNVVDVAFLPPFQRDARHGDYEEADHLWNALTALLVTRSGTLYAASPILFHGCIVPKRFVCRAILDLTRCCQDSFPRPEDRDVSSSTGSGNGNDGPEWRRNRAALQFLTDAFGISSAVASAYISSSALGNGNYVTASVGVGGGGRSALWPVSVQGPLFRGWANDDDNDHDDEDDDYHTHGLDAKHVLSMEVQSPPPTTNHHTTTAGSIVGVILARGIQRIEYLAIPVGNSYQPRFAFESVSDAHDLNEPLHDSGWIVERIRFRTDRPDGNDEDDQNEAVPEHARLLREQTIRDSALGGESVSRRVVLLVDPVDPTMIHFVSHQGVITVTTNVLGVVERRIEAAARVEMDRESTVSNRYRSKRIDGEEDVVKTNAWSCIEISSGIRGTVLGGIGDGVTLDGIVVSGDAQLGHVLVVQLSNGTFEAYNLTAAQYLHEASSLIANDGHSNTHSTSTALTVQNSNEMDDANAALQAMEAIPPLHELMTPLLQKVTAGLSSMGKIVGGHTKPSDITAGTLATFLSTKQTCEQDVILPLQQLGEVASTRLQYLQEMMTLQQTQLHKIQDMTLALRERMEQTKQRAVAAEKNSELLSQRSASVLSGARDLLPTITEAERRYFQQVRRYAGFCDKWETSVEQLKVQSCTMCDRMESGGDGGGARCEVKLGEKELMLCHDLLHGQDMLLKRSARTVKEMERRVQEFGLFGDDKG